MSNYCCLCGKGFHSSKLIRDKKLKPYYSKGLCLMCHPKMVQRFTKICVECQSPFIENQGLPAGVCPMCRITDFEMQANIVATALLRKADSFVDKSLTTDQWMATLKHFNGLCAYCQICAYECLEHFVPIKLGGGTCANNVVPSCLSCNALKKHLHPALVTSIPSSNIERVRSYLLSL